MQDSINNYSILSRSPIGVMPPNHSYYCSVPAVHSSRSQTWKVRADVSISEVLFKDDQPTMYSDMSVLPEVNEAVEVWVQRKQVERDRPFLLCQCTRMQRFVCTMRVLLRIPVGYINVRKLRGGTG